MMIETVTTLAHYVHDINPFIIEFGENPISQGIKWYGVAYCVGFLIAMWLLGDYSRRGISRLNEDQRSTFIIVIIASVILGGRLGSLVLYNWDAFIQNPMLFFAFKHGGMASHGAMVGCLVGAWIYSRFCGEPTWRLVDYIVSVAPPGIFLGRIGNFINGELYGKVTDVAWGVVFPKSAPWLPTAMIPARHPSQLYEALLEGLLLTVFMQIRIRRSPLPRPGILTFEFVMAYGVVRIFGEIFREPDASLILGISRGQFYSAVMILVAATGWIWLKKKR